jgi:S-DNA-T family DNA segregation ATPase FtsK/SpoIIIE
MANRKKRKPKAAPKRAQRSLLASRPSLPALQLEPQHFDIIGLALIAIGIFIAGVAYLHWSGGAVGEWAVKAMRFAFGALGYAVPAGLVAGGALVLARELRPPGRPMRTGIVCLVAASTLALAAATFGIGPGRLAGPSFWHAAAFERRGGVLGQAELWVSSHLVSTLGAHILAAFLLAAGLMLVTGATLAGVVRATGAGVLGTSRVLRRSTEELAATARRPGVGYRPAGSAPTFGVDPLLPPEPVTAVH